MRPLLSILRSWHECQTASAEEPLGDNTPSSQAQRTPSPASWAVAVPPQAPCQRSTRTAGQPYYNPLENVLEPPMHWPDSDAHQRTRLRVNRSTLQAEYWSASDSTVQDTMNDNHLLNINPRKIQRCLQNILTQQELDKIEAEVRVNVLHLLGLGRAHLVAARNLTGPASWRQKVSRGYYACYAVSRAVRLAHSGHYNQDVKDHDRVGDLPDDFPNGATWKDTLTKFRADRNAADYDHTFRPAELELPWREYLRQAQIFRQVATKYLRDRRALP